jgi:hypothetical protein
VKIAENCDHNIDPRRVKKSAKLSSTLETMSHILKKGIFATTFFPKGEISPDLVTLLTSTIAVAAFGNPDQLAKPFKNQHPCPTK